MRRAAIVSPIRTAVGKFQGSLASLTAGELGAVVLRALVERTGVDPGRVDDVIFAQGYGNGEAPCIARWSALAADLSSSPAEATPSASLLQDEHDLKCDSSSSNAWPFRTPSAYSDSIRSLAFLQSMG